MHRAKVRDEHGVVHDVEVPVPTGPEAYPYWVKCKTPPPQLGSCVAAADAEAVNCMQCLAAPLGEN